MSDLPRTIPQYLQQLRDALRGADAALVQDALYDAEDYLRSELAARPGVDEATLLGEVAASYGAPAEVADIYTAREQQVALAFGPKGSQGTAAGFAPAALRASAPAGLHAPAQAEAAGAAVAAAPARDVAPPTGFWRRFFGVAVEPRTYGALFYMLLALPLGIFHFSWAVTGTSLSAGLAILIIGIPFMIAFVATVYALSLVEGRLVEALLGERMPRRPVPRPPEAKLMERIKWVLTDGRTWSTLFYMVLMLPLGIAYFTIAVTLISVSVGLVAGSILQMLDIFGVVLFEEVQYGLPDWTTPFVLVFGVLLFFATLHLARGIGRMHGGIAKTMLVRLPREA